ncbi:MAG: maleylacetate reductase [Gemmatimonadaceae bacterium]
MTLSFTQDWPASRVLFGVGSLDRLGEEAERLDAKRILFISTPGRSEVIGRASTFAGNRLAGTFMRAEQHVPFDIVQGARAEAARVDADCCVAIGGGSAIGVAKMVALTAGLPLIAVPTTYSGSEMTSIWGMTSGGVKETGRDKRARPRCVLYDPSLTVAMPALASAASGMNAIAHAVEALYAPDGNPLISLMAEDAIRTLAASLPLISLEPTEIGARSTALFGAWLAGIALGSVSMGLHHRLCHVLGGHFGLPHAETHAVLLPHVAAYNASAAREASARVALAAGGDGAGSALYHLVESLRLPTALSSFGLAATDLDVVATEATREPFPNPRPVSRDDVRLLLEDAWHGNKPANS